MEERRGFHQLTFNEQEYLHLLQVAVERAEAAVDRGKRFQLGRTQMRRLAADLEQKQDRLRRELFRVLGSSKPVPVDASVLNPHPMQGEERSVSDDLRVTKVAYFQAVFEGRWDDVHEHREAMERLSEELIAMDNGGEGVARNPIPRAGEAHLRI